MSYEIYAKTLNDTFGAIVIDKFTWRSECWTLEQQYLTTVNRDDAWIWKSQADEDSF